MSYHITMKVCEYKNCNNEVVRKQNKYCSLSCSNKGRPARKKIWNNICGYCNNEFEVNSATKRKRFCNHSCSAIYNNRSRAKPKQICKLCGNEYPARNIGDYCSTSCRKKHKTELWLSGEIDGCWKYTHADYVRDYLEQRSNNSCEQCGYSKTREDESSILQVEHKDGNWRNNQVENLELLCPNCHCLTETWGAGNMGNGRTWKKKYNQFSKLYLDTRS